MPLTLKNFYKTWWQPWENTLLYLPLNWDLLDKSWNHNDWTAIWTISFQTVWNRQFAYFNSNSAIQLQTIPVWTWNPQAFTQVARLKTNSSWLWYMHHFWNDATHSRIRLVVFYNNLRPLQDMYGSSWDTYIWPASTSSLWDTRICVWYTYNNSKHKLYINWQLYWTWTNAINIWWTTNRNIWSVDWTWWYAMSECIFERWERTLQNFVDYYNLTKWNYWL